MQKLVPELAIFLLQPKPVSCVSVGAGCKEDGVSITLLPVPVPLSLYMQLL